MRQDADMNSNSGGGFHRHTWLRSEREQKGLRGAVKVCAEESVRLSTDASYGSEVPERRSWNILEFDPEGRLTARSHRNADGTESTIVYTYNSSGFLVKVTWGRKGEPPAEIINSFDHRGRVTSSTCVTDPSKSAVFNYDRDGRKSKVQVSREEDYHPNRSIAGSPFDAADRAPNLANGGVATTFYDDLNRPCEVLIRDSQGNLVGEAVRKYNQRGLITEEIYDLLPGNQSGLWTTLLKASGTSIETLRKQLTNLARDRICSIAYSYDSQDRVSKTVRLSIDQEEKADIAYNNLGDIETEIRWTKLSGVRTEKEQPAEYYETGYTYKYDNRGNWIERTCSVRSSPDEPFRHTITVLRTLTYW